MDGPTPDDKTDRAAAHEPHRGDPGDRAGQVASVEGVAGFGPRRYSWLPLAGAFTLAAVPVLAMLGARFL